MAQIKSAPTNAQLGSLNHVRARLKDGSESFESPMNQGHGKTVDDYATAGNGTPLWRVTNLAGKEAEVRAKTARGACSAAPIGGILSAKQVTTATALEK